MKDCNLIAYYITSIIYIYIYIYILKKVINHYMINSNFFKHSIKLEFLKFEHLCII